MKDKIGMYFDKKIATDFAAHEQNEKNFMVADIIDRVILASIWVLRNNFKACELGWGAHPDRYHAFFTALIQANGTIDWVDISPCMLKLAAYYIDAPEYKERLQVINFIEKDIVDYLESLEDDSIDLAIMKYTIDHIDNIDELFALLKRKLRKGWVLVSSVWVLSPELKSISTNARFLYNWKEFPENETRLLSDGDTFTVKFFLVSWNPQWWYIPWWETTKYYHSENKYQQAAKKCWFDIYLGDWKGLVSNNDVMLKQDILVLKK